MKFFRIISVLVSLASTVSAGTAYVHNHCKFPVYLWSVDQEFNPFSPMKLKSQHIYAEPYRTPRAGGVSIKLSNHQSLFGPITQFEYTLGGAMSGHIWYDVSNVNCHGSNCPFSTHGMYAKAGTGCPTVRCAAGVAFCGMVYNKPDDDHASLSCQENSDISLYLCSTSDVPKFGNDSGDDQETASPSPSQKPHTQYTYTSYSSFSTYSYSYTYSIAGPTIPSAMPEDFNNREVFQDFIPSTTVKTQKTPAPSTILSFVTSIKKNLAMSSANSDQMQELDPIQTEIATGSRPAPSDSTSSPDVDKEGIVVASQPSPTELIQKSMLSSWLTLGFVDSENSHQAKYKINTSDISPAKSVTVILTENSTVPTQPTQSTAHAILHRRLNLGFQHHCHFT